MQMSIFNSNLHVYSFLNRLNIQTFFYPFSIFYMFHKTVLKYDNALLEKSFFYLPMLTAVSLTP